MLAIYFIAVLLLNRMLFVLFSDVPECKIELGKSLNKNAIREGSDVYFDCLVKAEPPVYKVEWRHNVSYE